MNNTFTLPVTSEFSEDVNYLAWAREQIEDQFTAIDWTGREPRINAVDLRSASAFKVSLNRETVVDAVLSGSQYIIQFEGSIEYLIFDGDTTLTYFWCDWTVDRKNHKVPTFLVEANTTITVVDAYGITVPSTGTANSFELYEGWFTLTAVNADYVTATQQFLYLLEDEVQVYQTAKSYTITFSVTPSGSTIVVRDADSNVIAPTSNPLVYVLTDSTVAGNYSYSVSKTGYVTATGTINAQANATVTASLSIAQYAVRFNYTPTGATFTLKDASDSTVSPSSSGTGYKIYTLNDSRVSGAYSYTATLTDYVTATGSYSAVAADTQSVALVSELASIAITTPPTTTTYAWGEEFDPTGMVVTATYKDASTAAVTGYTWSPDGELEFGDDEIIISYTENGITKTTTQAVTVTHELVSIAITTAPTKTEYLDGDLFDDTGMVVTATYDDELTDEVDGYTWEPDDALSLSDDTITVSYTEGGVTKTAEQSVAVTKKLVSIAVTTPPTTTAYTAGQSFSNVGMVVTATYSDASTGAVTGYTWTPNGALTVEDTSVTISYTENGVTKTAEQAITVT